MLYSDTQSVGVIHTS